MRRDGDGSFSDGLRMNVLPHAIAIGDHPQRHHHREVERRDAGDDAERLADRVHVDARRHLLAVAALTGAAMPARELDDLEPAGDFASRIAEHLAVLAR